MLNESIGLKLKELFGPPEVKRIETTKAYCSHSSWAATAKKKKGGGVEGGDREKHPV